MHAPELAILVVEDHSFQLIAMQVHLNRTGFFCLTPALDAEEARKACQWRGKPIDPRLCDINLPATNGVELLGEVAAYGKRYCSVARRKTNQRGWNKTSKAAVLPSLSACPNPWTSRRGCKPWPRNAHYAPDALPPSATHASRAHHYYTLTLTG